MTFPRIWVVGGYRPGDEAQLYALAEELRLPFETRKLVYNWRYWLGGRYMGASLSSLKRDIRERTIAPPWPDLILLAGKRSVPIARWVQEQNGGRTRLVLIGHPRVSPHLFDLIYTTRQYQTPSAPPVRLLPVTMSRYREPPNVTDEESTWLDALPRPRHLLMLGGDTRHWKLRPSAIAATAEKLAQRALRSGGSLIAVRSARTSEEAIDAIERQLESSRCEWRTVRHNFPRFPVLLNDADVLFPTGDSISMISESVITGKPVGIVPVEMSWFGWLELGGEHRVHRKDARDLRRFWNFLFANGLAGPMDEPRASDTPNPVVAAAAEVRAMLEQSFGKLPA